MPLLENDCLKVIDYLYKNIYICQSHDLIVGSVPTHSAAAPQTTQVQIQTRLYNQKKHKRPKM